jgi:hypothetical protein
LQIPACLAFLVLGTSILIPSMSSQADWTRTLNSSMSNMICISMVLTFCHTNGTKITHAKMDNADSKVAACAPK